MISFVELDSIAHHTGKVTPAQGTYSSSRPKQLSFFFVVPAVLVGRVQQSVSVILLPLLLMHGHFWTSCQYKWLCWTLLLIFPQRLSKLFRWAMETFSSITRWWRDQKSPSRMWTCFLMWVWKKKFLVTSVISPYMNSSYHLLFLSSSWADFFQ